MAENNNPIKYSDLIKPDNSITELIKQLDQLSDAYTNALQNIKNEAIQLSATLQKVSGATDTGRKATQKAADDADRLARAQRELAFAESETAKQIAELKQAQQEANQINKLTVKLNQSAEGSYNRLSAQYSLNKIYINNMTKAERENTEEGRKLVAQTREIYEEMKRLQKETGKNQLNVGNYTEASDALIEYGDRLKESLGLNSKFGESLLALGRGGEESKAVFTSMADGAKALGKTLLTLLSNPVFLAIAGIAAAGAAFKWWYDYNAGLVEATRLTQQFTNKQGDDLQAFRNEVQATADMFNSDFKETLIATNAVAQQFGISANEALKLVQDGFIAGGDANGEFLDTLKEYPAYFKEAGISADQFVAIVAQTNKMGIFSDKGVDAIKEANLRLREMTTATASALEGIGISSEQVQADLQSGAKTTFDVIQDVSERLSELPDSAAVVGAAIADIFGEPGEDAGLQYLRTLKDISTDLDTVKEKAGVLGELQEEQLKSQIELQNALSGLFDLTGGNFETLTTKAKVFFNQGLTAIIKGVISLANYFIEIYNESLLLRAVWNSISVVVKNFFDGVGNLFNFFVDTIKAVGTALKGAFTLNYKELKKGLSDFALSYKKLATAQIKDMSKNAKEAFEGMDKKIKPITIPVSVETGETGKGSGVVTGTVTPAKKGDNVEDKTKEIEQAYKKNIELTRKLQDEQLKLEDDEWAKKRQKTIYQYDRQIEDLRHQLDTEKELNKEGREKILETIVALEAQKTADLLAIENERQNKELEMQKKGIELRLSAVQKGTEEERKLRLQLLDVEKQIAIQQSGDGEKDAIIKGFEQSRMAINDEYLQLQLDAFDKQQELAQSEFDLLKNSEEKKTQYRLQAEKARWQKILEINKEASNKLSDVDVAIIENTIKKIDQEIESSKKAEKSNDIYGLFGLNLTDEQKEGINTSLQYAIDALNEYSEARVEAANNAVEQAEKEVDAAQSALDAERQAAANGYANNVAQAQKELDLAKKNQDKAIQEQKKAQQEQEAIQTLQQVGNLVTASALIWAQLGFPAAIPAIALMWASFAASKIKAFQMASTGTETYGDGTVELLQGGSHQSGNDVDLGTKPDGTKRRAEGGEFFAVINKRSSRMYRRVIPDVIKSLNNGTFLNKYAGTENGNVNVTFAPKNGRLEKDVEKIRQQTEKKIYVGDGVIVEQYKNLKKRIRK